MAFAPSKGKKNKKKEEAGLSLNSMMDMMTIILLFLLKSMSTSGALIRPSPYLELPKAERIMEPKKAVAILITADGVLEDMESDPRVLSARAEIDDPENVILPGLEGFLNENREFVLKTGRPFKGEITIQCDKGVTYDWLLKVINTCGQTEFATIDFVVIKVET
jgi:biopolymer transport protein ExbD